MQVYVFLEIILPMLKYYIYNTIIISSNAKVPFLGPLYIPFLFFIYVNYSKKKKICIDDLSS